MRCPARSWYDTFHVFEPRPGDLVAAGHGDVHVLDGTPDRGVVHRVLDADGGVVVTGTRRRCIDVVELAWWRAEAATLGADQVAAAAYAGGLVVQRWDEHRGFVTDPHLSRCELALHTGTRTP